MQNRREFLQIMLAGASAGLILPNLSFGQTAAAAKTFVDAWAQVPQILARIKPPKFPNKDFVITKYGARADGATDNSDAIRQAIEACNKAGGGRVVVPKGEFVTGAIHLRRNFKIQPRSESVFARCVYALGRHGINEPFAVHLCL